MLPVVAFLLLSLLCVCEAQEKETYAQKLLHVAYDVETNPELRSLWYAARDFNDYMLGLPGVQFGCQVEVSPSPPISVHTLRPGDIGVIGAFGDAITAGNGVGATTPSSVAIENRGEAFSIGGDQSLEQGILTLTNVLRQWNPDIKGFSHCSGNSRNVDRAWLNVAETEGDNRQIIMQVDEAIARMLNDSRIDINADWKVFSLLLGQNDICNSCDVNDLYDPEVYGSNVRKAVDRLFDLVPRVFLNLIPTYDVTPAANYSTSRQCDVLQGRFCECALNESTRAELRSVQLAYYDELQKIAEDLKYTQRLDFAVVLQPFLVDWQPVDPNTGEVNSALLAPDCFHPSKMGQQAFAFWLWDTMLTPVGHKALSLTADFATGPNVLSCPTTENPYFFTNGNSNVNWP